MRALQNLLMGGSLLILLASFAQVASAQSRVLAVDDLAKRAEVVAVGRVSAMKSEWSADRKYIITKVTNAVEEYVKGSDASAVTVTTLGGEVDDVGEIYTHVPTFQPNENVVVFLQKDRQGEYRVSGGTRGRYAR